MKRVEISINGTAHPCGPTMGAMLCFKQQTGREINQIDTSSFSDLCTYLWCCVASAAKREDKPFDMTLMDFADNLSPEDMAAWSESISEDAAGDEDKGEKKRKHR